MRQFYIIGGVFSSLPNIYDAAFVENIPSQILNIGLIYTSVVIIEDNRKIS